MRDDDSFLFMLFGRNAKWACVAFMVAIVPQVAYEIILAMDGRTA